VKYYFSATVSDTFDNTIARVRKELEKEGFGVLTEIDVQATMKKKLNEEYRPYTILGACNAPFAHKALQAEDKIGTMLPCNVIVREEASGQIEVAAVDPIASMQAVDNPLLAPTAAEVRAKLQRVIDAVSAAT
jgi:uncharacterized protein (DUF302 family)